MYKVTSSVLNKEGPQNLLPVSLTPVVNLSLVSLTPVVNLSPVSLIPLVNLSLHGVVDNGDKMPETI